MDFYPRPPRGGRPCALPLSWLHSPISIHALREEGDVRCSSMSWSQSDFYPRPPRGGRLVDDSHLEALEGFLSTPSARRATRKPCTMPMFRSISIHALREEGDRIRRIQSRRSFRFLSTPSARRATRYLSKFATKSINFYPRPPRGGRPPGVRLAVRVGAISIHALREEGDLLRLL